MENKWISVKDKLPTQADANEYGYVLTFLAEGRQWCFPTRIGFSKWSAVSVNKHTHWHRLPSSPPNENQSK